MEKQTVGIKSEAINCTKDSTQGHILSNLVDSGRMDLYDFVKIMPFTNGITVITTDINFAISWGGF